MIDLTPLTFALTVLATIVMAATAAIQGARQGFDPFGTTVLAIVTAIGGGTLRDLLIGVTPIFWLIDMTYLGAAVPIGFLTYFIAKHYDEGVGKRLITLQYLDGIGLALFTLVGTQVALDNNIPMASAVVLGCITGVTGGMFRDVLCGLQPEILKSDLYATLSIIGGTIYVVGQQYLPESYMYISVFVLMVLLRSFIIYRNSKKNPRK